MPQRNTSPKHPLAYNRTWQKRLLLLTLIAAVILDGFFTLFFLLPEPVIWYTTGLIVVQAAIDLFLLIGLLRFREKAFPWIVWRAVSLWLIWLITLTIAFQNMEEAFFWATNVTVVSIPLLLLAIGRPGKLRMFLAMLILVVYVVFLGFFVWVIMNPDTID